MIYVEFRTKATTLAIYSTNSHFEFALVWIIKLLPKFEVNFQLQDVLFRIACKGVDF